MAENKTEWQALLAKVERDLAEHEKKGLELKATRNYLRKLLGLSIEERVETPAEAVEVHTGILPTFRKGDFYGFSQAEAGYRVLERAGGSLTTDEILQVLKESGYEVGGQDPKKTLHSSLCRSRKLVIVAKHTFDLKERRPKARKPREKEEEKTGEEVAVIKKEKGKKRKAQSEEQAQTAPKGGEEKESD